MNKKCVVAWKINLLIIYEIVMEYILGTIDKNLRIVFNFFRIILCCDRKLTTNCQKSYVHQISFFKIIWRYINPHERTKIRN